MLFGGRSVSPLSTKTKTQLRQPSKSPTRQDHAFNKPDQKSISYNKAQLIDYVIFSKISQFAQSIKTYLICTARIVNKLSVCLVCIRASSTKTTKSARCRPSKKPYNTK